MRASLLVLLLVGGCGAQTPQRPPDLEAAYRRIEREPNRADAYVQLARLYLKRGDYLRARQYLTIAERLPAQDHRELFRVGLVIAVRSGQYEDAILRCRRQLDREENPHVRLLLASMYEALGRWTDAERERKLVMAAWPQDLHQVIEMARFYQRWGQADAEVRAAALYRRYLEVAPGGDEAPQARAALASMALDEESVRRGAQGSERRQDRRLE